MLVLYKATGNPREMFDQPILGMAGFCSGASFLKLQSGNNDEY